VGPEFKPQYHKKKKKKERKENTSGIPNLLWNSTSQYLSYVISALKKMSSINLLRWWFNRELEESFRSS
jgi:hypothetical protein